MYIHTSIHIVHVVNPQSPLFAWNNHRPLTQSYVSSGDPVIWTMAFHTVSGFFFAISGIYPTYKNHYIWGNMCCRILDISMMYIHVYISFIVPWDCWLLLMDVYAYIYIHSWPVTFIKKETTVWSSIFFPVKTVHAWNGFHSIIQWMVSKSCTTLDAWTATIR